MEIKRTCPVCGDVLLGRVDKKFCSDQCRTTFNNQKNKDTSNILRRVNSILRRNRRILARFNTNGTTRVHRHKLVEQGFDFRFFTHIGKKGKGNTCYYCYDQGYFQTGKGYFTIVRTEGEF